MSNKDFSNWLVVSDIDGTLNNKLRKLPKRNFEAIKHFVLKCNGHFTLASGRNVESMRKHYDRLPIKGTPAVVLNGAGVYDYSQEKMLHYIKDFYDLAGERLQANSAPARLITEVKHRPPLGDSSINCCLPRSLGSRIALPRQNSATVKRRP